MCGAAAGTRQRDSAGRVPLTHARITRSAAFAWRRDRTTVALEGSPTCLRTHTCMHTHHTQACTRCTDTHAHTTHAQTISKGTHTATTQHSSIAWHIIALHSRAHTPTHPHTHDERAAERTCHGLCRWPSESTAQGVQRARRWHFTFQRWERAERAHNGGARRTTHREEWAHDGTDLYKR